MKKNLVYALPIIALVLTGGVLYANIPTKEQPQVEIIKENIPVTAPEAPQEILEEKTPTIAPVQETPVVEPVEVADYSEVYIAVFEKLNSDWNKYPARLYVDHSLANQLIMRCYMTEQDAYTKQNYKNKVNDLVDKLGNLSKEYIDANKEKACIF